MNMNMLFHERYFSSRIMCIKGFVNRLSHDCQKDIDRGVSTSYSRSSSGNGVDLLSRTICTKKKNEKLVYNKTGHYLLWDEVKFIDRDPHWYSRTVKRLLTYDLTLKTSTGTMVLRFLKRGYPRSDNIAVDRYHNGPLRELGPPLIMPTMLWIGTHLP